jgi:hypothetical protein
MTWLQRGSSQKWSKVRRIKNRKKRHIRRKSQKRRLEKKGRLVMKKLGYRIRQSGLAIARIRKRMVALGIEIEEDDAVTSN